LAQGELFGPVSAACRSPFSADALVRLSGLHILTLPRGIQPQATLPSGATLEQ